MKKVPVFIEVPTADGKADTHVCQMARVILESLGHDLLPLVHNLDSLKEQLDVLKQHDAEPAIYVINTFGAKDILKELEPLLGECPVLFLRRNLYAGQSGLTEHFDIGTDSANTMSVIKSMSVRLLAVWNYGKLNSTEIARNTARNVDSYLKTGDFRPIERLSQSNIKTR